MIYVKSTEVNVLNELAKKLEDFPVNGVVAILEDTLSHARSYSFPFVLDLEVIANSWLSESEEYVLKSHKVEDLEELHDTIHRILPPRKPNILILGGIRGFVKFISLNILIYPFELIYFVFQQKNGIINLLKGGVYSETRNYIKV